MESTSWGSSDTVVMISCTDSSTFLLLFLLPLLLDIRRQHPRIIDSSGRHEPTGTVQPSDSATNDARNDALNNAASLGASGRRLEIRKVRTLIAAAFAEGRERLLFDIF
jgi:hypothetical protein